MSTSARKLSSGKIVGLIIGLLLISAFIWCIGVPIIIVAPFSSPGEIIMYKGETTEGENNIYIAMLPDNYLLVWWEDIYGEVNQCAKYKFYGQAGHKVCGDLYKLNTSESPLTWFIGWRKSLTGTTPYSIQMELIKDYPLDANYPQTSTTVFEITKDRLIDSNNSYDVMRTDQDTINYVLKLLD